MYKVAKAVIPNSDSPSLACHKGNADIHLMLRNRSTGAYHNHAQHRYGHDVRGGCLMAQPWPDSYTNAHLAVGMNGERFTLALDGSALKFKRSFDGLTFDDEVPVGTVTTSPKTFHIVPQSPSGSSVLLITNGAQAWISDDSGATWLAITIDSR